VGHYGIFSAIQQRNLLKKFIKHKNLLLGDFYTTASAIATASLFPKFLGNRDIHI